LFKLDFLNLFNIYTVCWQIELGQVFAEQVGSRVLGKSVDVHFGQLTNNETVKTIKI